MSWIGCDHCGRWNSKECLRRSNDLPQNTHFFKCKTCLATQKLIEDIVREWPAVKADIAQLKQKGSETSLGDSSSDPVTLNVSLVNLQEELNNERSLRLSLESTLSHRVNSGEIAKLKLELDKERSKRLAEESADLSLQKDSDSLSLSLQEKLQIASEENEKHKLLIEDLNTRIRETHVSSPLVRPSVPATRVQELQAHIPSSKSMILEDLSTSRLPPSACPAPHIPSSSPSVPSSITRPVPLNNSVHSSRPIPI